MIKSLAAGQGSEIWGQPKFHPRFFRPAGILSATRQSDRASHSEVNFFFPFQFTITMPLTLYHPPN